jgi:hypothetical protein
MSDNEDRVYTGRGVVNDLEANLLRVCKRAFEENEYLRFLGKHHPKEYHDQDPNIIKRIEELPVLCAWCDGFTPSTDSIGQQVGREMNQKIYFVCNVSYILPLIQDREDDKVLKQIAWELHNEITENKNLNGLIAGPAIIAEASLGPDILRVGDKARQVSTASFKILYLYQQRIKMARR